MFVVSIRPFVEKIADDKVFFTIDGAIKYKDLLNKKYDTTAYKVFRMICSIDKEPIS